MTYPPARNIVALVTTTFKAHADEVNRLNVFPVPDGDTGTNMSLTLDAVLDEIAQLPLDASLADVCRAATHGSLMGARGNSGVITSQIIRGLCEGLSGEEATKIADTNPVERIALALESARRVAYQAVRKPVEGTILTVCADISIAAREAADRNLTLEDAFDHICKAAHDSVARTPELLPVLKEAGVVDAGGYGLALICDAFAAGLLGREVAPAPAHTLSAELTVAVVDDWDDDEFLYCTEFLLFGDRIDREATHDYIAARGGSELVVGDGGQYKIHVHTDNPAEILSFALTLGEVAEVHIHNMRRQQAERPGGAAEADETHHTVAVVAVASGSGIIEILKSLGVNRVVSGGQTMNPSTADLVKAATSINCDNVIFLPNNKNIIMAANAAVEVLAESGQPAFVVPTTSVPQAFAAMLSFEPDGDCAEMVEGMTEEIAAVNTAEITTAIKDATMHGVTIQAGQVIAVVNGSDIEAIGSTVDEVARTVLTKLVTEDAETLTVLIGEDLSVEEGEALSHAIEQEFPALDIELLRGEQPLYPVILAVE